MSLRTPETATPESIQNLAALNCLLAIQVKDLTEENRRYKEGLKKVAAACRIGEFNLYDIYVMVSVVLKGDTK